MQVKSSAFLCGYFTTSLPISSSNVPLGWETIEENNGRSLVDSPYNFYYSEFVDFFEKDVLTIRKPIDSDVKLQIDERIDDAKVLKAVPFRIVDVTVYQMPMNMAIFAIHVEFAGIEENDALKALMKLRSCVYYNMTKVEEFVNVAIRPVFDIYKACGGPDNVYIHHKDDDEIRSYPFLVEHGNKLKLFQIVLPEDLPENGKSLKEYIYCLGSLSPYEKELGFDNSDDSHFASVMKDGYISVYKRWKILTLLDTATILASPPPSARTLQVWKETYFGKIYVYELYRKNFLYRLNYDFRSSSRDAKVLQDDMRKFERQYAFENISYNFLPSMLDSAIEKALNSKAEEEIINHVINQEIAERDEKRENRTNHLLILLSVLAIFSAIWDLLSLVKDVQEEFNLTATIISGSVLAVLIIIFISIRKWGH